MLSVIMGTKIVSLPFVSAGCKLAGLCYVLAIVFGHSSSLVISDDIKTKGVADSLLFEIIGYNRNGNDDQLNSSLLKEDQLLGTKGFTVCRQGETQPHPVACFLYLECSSHGDRYHVRWCPDRLSFDPETLTCSPGYNRCQTLRLRHKRAIDSDTDINFNSDMGSGDVVDPDNAAGPVLPSGNETAEAADPGLADHSTKLEVTVPKVHVTDGLAPVTEGHVPLVVDDVTHANIASPNTTVTIPTEKVTYATNATTVIETTTVPSTTELPTSAPMVIVTDKSPKPPYVIVTEPPLEASTKNATFVGVDSAETSHAGAIIGGVVVVLVVALIIGILVFLVKKKKVKVPTKMRKVSVTRKKKIVTRMENPQYQGSGGKDYRFSRDSALHIGGPTVNLTKFNNPNLADTPMPRVLQSESPNTAKRSSLPRSIASRREKRKAPPPPNPFGEFADDDDDKGDLYEKASQGSAEVELQTFTVRNENATDPPEQEQELSYPLLKRSGSKKDTDKVKDKNDNDNSDVEAGNDNTISDAPSDSLLPKDKVKSKSKDKVSIDMKTDDYDEKNNPFFDED